MQTISYRTDATLTASQLAGVFDRSGIKRPTRDLERMGRMLEHCDLLITAWDEELLVGVARSLTDFSYGCYLSDLAVDVAYQRMGIGRELVRLTKETTGEECTLLLLSAPGAMEYYPRIGFEPVINGWIVNRTR